MICRSFDAVSLCLTPDTISPKNGMAKYQFIYAYFTTILHFVFTLGFDLLVTVIVALPFFLALILPELLTVATFVLLLL